MQYKLCKHIHNDGRACGSAAAKGRDYCSYHLDYRIRQHRMAQYRARGQRFSLQLPPLESMHAVQSALTQLSEAVAADMIDLKRADRLMGLLTIASRNLLKADKWPASPYHSDQPGPAVDLAAQYGLPADLDIDTPPELAFPPPSEPTNSVILSEGGLAAAVEGPALFRSPLFPEIPPPYVRDYAAEAEAAMYEVTPESLELDDILKTQGYKAMERRAVEHRRDEEHRKQRKLFRANYAHYAAVAKTKNIERAAEKLLAQRQAAEKAAAAQAATQAATQQVVSPIPPPVGGVGPLPDTTRKPVASATSETFATEEAATA